MSQTRRDFLAGAAGAIGLLSAAPLGAWADEDELQPASVPAGVTRADKPLKILILGGTGFLGPHIVEYAVGRGHALTLFNRGKTNPALFPNIERLAGDRDGKLDALRGRQWDAVVDTSGYVPRIVRMSADLLRDAVRQYLFVSSVSVYATRGQGGIDESSPVATLEDPTNEDVRQHYGALKAMCERAAEEILPGRVTNVRPGLIVGPRDPSDRFTYWPVRVARGGEVLAPHAPDEPIQFIDVRDLASWIVLALERNFTGVFNAVGPVERGRYTIGELLDACKEASHSDARFTWVDDSFLAEQGVRPWSDLPVWVPARGETAGFAGVRADRAIARGMSFRPVRNTAADTLAWFNTLPEERRTKLRAGLPAEREARVLAAWHDRRRKS